MNHDLRPYLRTDVQARTSSGALVVMCAALGSPVSEVARVVDVSPRLLRDTVRGRELLGPPVAGLVGRWISCLWWRTLWRLGHPTGNDREELDAVSRLALTLPWLPDDWAADLARAALWYEVRPEERSRWARIGEANGLSKLTRADVEAIKGLRKAGWSIRRIAKRYAVSASTVHHRVGGRK